MSDIIIDGQTYEGVETITAQTTDGGTTVFSENGGSGGITLKSQTFDDVRSMANFIQSIGIENVKCVKLKDGSISKSVSCKYYDPTTDSYLSTSLSVSISPIIYPVNYIESNNVTFIASTHYGAINIRLSMTNNQTYYSGGLCGYAFINNSDIPFTGFLNVGTTEAFTPTLYYFE